MFGLVFIVLCASHLRLVYFWTSESDYVFLKRFLDFSPVYDNAY